LGFGRCDSLLQPVSHDAKLLRMQVLKIIALCVIAACAYGVVQDQVTARVCIEYFTIGHPRLFADDSPALHGLAWGIIATWWVGALLGIILAIAARAGRAPKLAAKDLVRPLGVLLVCIAVVAAFAGTIGYVAARNKVVWLLEPLASRVPADRHVPFIGVLWAHVAAYGAGFLGGLAICAFLVYRRTKRATLEAAPPEPPPPPLS